VLVVDGQPFSREYAAIEYLEERFPQNPLFPTNALKRGQARAIASMVDDLCPIHDRPSWEAPVKLFEDIKTQKREGLQEGLKNLEEVIALHTGKFCIGNEVTVADIYLAPVLIYALGWLHTLPDNLPRLQTITNNFFNLDSIKNLLPASKSFTLY